MASWRLFSLSVLVQATMTGGPLVRWITRDWSSTTGRLWTLAVSTSHSTRVLVLELLWRTQTIDLERK